MKVEKVKNPHAVALGKIGGSRTSKAKKLAAKRNIEKRWGKNKLTRNST